MGAIEDVLFNILIVTPSFHIGVQRAIRRCHLEIAVSVWASHYEYLIEFSEGVQRKAAEMLPGLKGKYFSYLL